VIDLAARAGIATGGLVHALLAAVGLSVLLDPGARVEPIGTVVGRLAWLQCCRGKLIGAIFISLGVRVAFQRREEIRRGEESLRRTRTFPRHKPDSPCYIHFHDVPHCAHYAIPNRRTAGALIVHV
jgi:hypothetical protein